MMNGKKEVAIIVAHPDDETLWAGGIILCNPSWDCFIVSLCRGKDQDRSVKFHNALKKLNSQGIMGDLDDEPEQKPLEENKIQNQIRELLPEKHFDLIITHSPSGEYTRHLRHEETGKAIITLWHAGEIHTNKLLAFAYEDGGKQYRPRAIETASIYQFLPPMIWRKKYQIITETYGFKPDSFEAESVPKAESFWLFVNPNQAWEWLNKGNISV
ncbi:MAG: PIG-L family deacetylase [Bacteroidota bacterium]|nr:PIG-L family deacetylase [Bacteroidota bacterium]MDP4206291.1 PIG-L family deacetylase [Bacteroidota bacterium]